MSAATAIASMRAGWLVLCTMMLLSRVIFQAAGATRMRAFLDRWQVGTVKRLWGVAALLFATWTTIVATVANQELGVLDVVFGVVLVLVLLADGVANVLPTGFETFKDRLQRAWVARHRGTARADDAALFGTLNLVLAVGAALAAGAVIVYRPISLGLVLASVTIGTALTVSLVVASGRP